jgi:hypothetical protein
MVGEGNGLVGGEHPHYNKWNKYLHTRRAYYEAKLTAAVREAAPRRHSYNYYTWGGYPPYGRWGGYDDWAGFMLGVGRGNDIADYPGSSLYRPDNGRILNAAGTDNAVNDLLSAAIAAKGVELRHGMPLNQSWGWVREDMFGIFDQYIGFLKCLYVLGQVGHIQFLFPEGAAAKRNYDFDRPVDPEGPPTWLRQVEQLARVYAVFTHLDTFIFDGELVEGPHRHIFWQVQNMQQPLPGYVLDNPHELFRDSGGSFKNPRPGRVRVVARRKPDGELLICAWAADGVAREVPATLPGGAELTLQATPRGALYRGPGDGLVRIHSEEPGIE